MAERIKKEFDKKHGPTWHCIVGSNFGKTSNILVLSSHRIFSSLDIGFVFDLYIYCVSVVLRKYVVYLLL